MSAGVAHQTYAWNFHLQAYSCPEHPGGHVRLNIKELTSTLKGEFVKTPPVQPVDAELATVSNGTVKVLWVGMKPSKAKDFKAATQKGSYSVDMPPAKFTVVPATAEDLRVVTSLETSNNNFFELVNPDDQGICQTRNCPAEQVFFFREYRDDTTVTVEGRKGTWRSELKKYKDNVRQAIASKTARTRNEAANTSVPPIGRTESLVNGLSSLSATYLVSPEAWILTAMKEMLEELDVDLKDKPIYECATLHKLMSPSGTVFTEEDAEMVIKEAKTLWPDLDGDKSITPNAVRSVNLAVSESNKAIPWRLLRPTLVLYTSLYDSDGVPTPDVATTSLGKVLGMVNNMLGGGAGRDMSVDDSQTMPLLRATIARLESIIKTSKTTIAALDNIAGGHLTGESLDSLYKKYGNVPDVDATRILVHQGLKLGVKELSQYVMGCHTQLEGWLSQLKKLMQTLEADVDEMQSIE